MATGGTTITASTSLPKNTVLSSNLQITNNNVLDVNMANLKLGLTTPIGGALNTFDLLGDSRINFQTAPAGYQNSLHFFNQANAQNGHRYILGNMLGIAGDRTDQYLNAGLAKALASTSKYCVIWGVVNDIIQQVTALQAWQGGKYTVPYNGASISNPGIFSACQQLIAAGKIPILISETGQNGWTAANILQMTIYNELARELAESGQVIYVDFTQTLWNLATSTQTLLQFNTNYFQDSLHPNTWGSYLVAPAFIAAVPAIPPLFVPPVAPTEDPSYQILSNNLFETTTGGTTSGSITGTVPAGWQLTIPSGWTCTVTYTANPNGAGNLMNLAITSNGLGQFTLAQTLFTGVVGGIYYAGASINVASGSSNYVGNDTEFSAFTSAGLSAFLDYSYGGTLPLGPAVAYNYTTKTQKVALPAGSAIGFLQFATVGTFQAAGSRTISIGQTFLRQRFS